MALPGFENQAPTVETQTISQENQAPENQTLFNKVTSNDTIDVVYVSAKVGDTVYFRLPTGRHAGEYRPAAVTFVHPSTVPNEVFVDLDVAIDGEDDFPLKYFPTSVVQGPELGRYVLTEDKESTDSITTTKSKTKT